MWYKMPGSNTQMCKLKKNAAAYLLVISFTSNSTILQDSKGSTDTKLIILIDHVIQILP